MNVSTKKISSTQQESPEVDTLAGSLSEYAKNVDPNLSWAEIREIAWTRSLLPKYKKLGYKIKDKQ